MRDKTGKRVEDEPMLNFEGMIGNPRDFSL